MFCNPTCCFAHQPCRVGDEEFTVCYGGPFSWLARVPVDSARDFMMNHVDRTRIKIHLSRIRTDDLIALSVVLKDVGIGDLDISMLFTAATGEEDALDRVRTNIPILLCLLRSTNARKRRIAINDLFIRGQFAALFGDFVFDLVEITTSIPCRGSDVPLCRVLSHFTLNGGTFSVEKTDAIVQTVKTINLNEMEDHGDSWQNFDPTTLRLWLATAGSFIDRLISSYRNVEKLYLMWNHNNLTHLRCAALLRRLPRVHTLVIQWKSTGYVVVPEEFVAALASLPRLRRLRLHFLKATNLDFLYRLPRLEKLRVTLGNVTALTIDDLAYLPLLRTFVIDDDTHDPEWKKVIREEISRVRTAWMDPFLKQYHGLARITSGELARLICLMCCRDKIRLIYRETMRSLPQCSVIDDDWKLSTHKRKRAESLAEGDGNQQETLE